jgi:hypothetical protein
VWFQDLVSGDWWHVEGVLRFFVVADGTAWAIKFVQINTGTTVYATGYLTKVLAQAALATLIATFTV